MELTSATHLLRGCSYNEFEAQLASRLQWRRYRRLSAFWMSACLPSAGRVAAALPYVRRFDSSNRIICSAGPWIRKANPHHKEETTERRDNRQPFGRASQQQTGSNAKGNPRKRPTLLMRSIAHSSTSVHSPFSRWPSPKATAQSRSWHHGIIASIA